MENRKPLGRYLMGAYIFLLSLPVFIGWFAALSSHASGGELILLGYFIMAALFIFLSLGLLTGQHWAGPLGKYVYPILVVPILGLGSFTFAALAGSSSIMMSLWIIVFAFDSLFLLYIFPVILYFHSDVIKRLSLWVKILFVILLLGPILIFVLFYPRLILCPTTSR